MPVAAGIVGIGAGIGTSILQNDANQSALSAQQNALNQLKTLDIPTLEKMASDQDLAKYKADFDAQAKIDPNFAAMRTQGSQGILDALKLDASGKSLADTSLKGFSDAAGKNSAANQPIIDSLLAQAKQELSAGATLPPEFQAELVRSGLETNGQGGLNIDGRGAAGTNIRTLVGSAGLQLQAQRRQQAQSMTGTASALQTQQQNALAELSQLSNNLTNSKMNRGVTATTMGNATVPSIGLTGGDAVNMSIANTNLDNNRTQAIGNVNASRALSTGAMWTGILGAGTGGLGSMMGTKTKSDDGTVGSYLGGLLK
jgi:hypothetical protein